MLIDSWMCVHSIHTPQEKSHAIVAVRKKQIRETIYRRQSEQELDQEESTQKV